MVYKLADRIVETTGTAGTGTLSLNGATVGFQAFITGVGNGNTCPYCITDGTNWEVGEGTVTAAAPNLLSRDTVLANSVGTTAKINFPAGAKAVFLDVPIERRCYFDGAGRKINGFAGAGSVLTGDHGQCRLIKSAANLLLSPFNGQWLIISGTPQPVPAAGVSLAPPATTGTVYYIYAFMAAGVMTLEASATAYSVDAATGIAVKTGDATRTLVGMSRTVASAWVDSSNLRLVRSWFNSGRIDMNGGDMGGATVNSATYVDIGGASFQLEWLNWAGECVDLSFTGTQFNSLAGAFVGSTIGIDGAASISVPECGFHSSGTGYRGAVACRLTTELAEGYHFARPMGVVGSGSGTWPSATIGGPSGPRLTGFLGGKAA
jgi:hypothetical protein